MIVKWITKIYHDNKLNFFIGKSRQDICPKFILSNRRTHDCLFSKTSEKIAPTLGVPTIKAENLFILGKIEGIPP
jgi:hypothetical protein